jgi:hypothetical protein
VFLLDFSLYRTNQDLALSCDRTSTAETIQLERARLTDNYPLCSTPSGIQVVSPNAFSDGKRQIDVKRGVYCQVLAIPKMELPGESNFDRKVTPS